MSPAPSGDEPGAPPSTGPSRRAFLAGGLACAFCAAGGGAVGWDLARRNQTRNLGLVVPTKTLNQRRKAQPDALFSVQTRHPLVGLSFDDGPDPAYTPHVMRLLDQHHATATFFTVGVNAQAHPHMVTDQVKAGHTVGNHTFFHPYLEDLNGPSVREEIDLGEAAIVATGAPRPTLFRPPRGYTDEVIGVTADKDRYKTVFWTQCVERYVLGHEVEDGVKKLLRDVRPGSIILAHDGGHILTPGYAPISRAQTMRALPLLFAGLEALGLRGVSVPELVLHADRL